MAREKEPSIRVKVISIISIAAIGATLATAGYKAERRKYHERNGYSISQLNDKQAETFGQRSTYYEYHRPTEGPYEGLELVWGKNPESNEHLTGRAYDVITTYYVCVKDQETGEIIAGEYVEDPRETMDIYPVVYLDDTKLEVGEVYQLGMGL